VGRRQCLFLRRSAAPSSRRHRDRKKGRLALSKRSSLFSSGASLFLLRAVLVVSASVSARVAEEFDSGVFFFVLPFFFWALLALFSLSGEILTSRFRLFFNALVFFSWFFVLPKNRGFCGPQTSSMKKEKTPLTKHTVSFLFLLCFFFSVVCRKRFILPDDLFLKEEKNLIKHRTLFLFLSHTSSNQTSARKARKKKTVLALRRPFCRRLIKKTSPIIRVKSPTTNRRPQRERTRRQQTTTTTTTTTNDALWRKERRHFWTTTTTTTTGQQK